MCLAAPPYAALSLRSTVPITLGSGTLGFYVRGDAGNGSSSPGRLGDLEIQWESSSPGGEYAITPSVTLAELLEQQAGGSSSDANATLAAIEGGQWTAVKAPLASFAGSQGSAAGTFRADRLTMGYCLQRLEGCSSTMPSLQFCLDKILIVN